METINVPDLQNGFMIMQYEGANRWATGVECVLVRHRPESGQPQHAYLAHECRAEAVNDDPFGHPGEYEHVSISTWAGNYALRSGGSLVGVKDMSADELAGRDMSYEKLDMEIQVRCDQVEARPMSFSEVTQLLQSDFQSGYLKLHMAITYHQDGNRYVLYAPCRYVNFPHPTKSDRSYLQPISGYMLHEKDERFSMAYVVLHIKAGRTEAIQFKLRDRVSSGEYVTHEFCKLHRIEDEQMHCQFFVYG